MLLSRGARFLPIMVPMGRMHQSGTIGSSRASRVTILLAFALAAVSCSHGVSRIETRSLPKPNPTVYLFPRPLEEVHAAAWQAFSSDHQWKEPIFGKSASTDSTARLESTLLVESSTNALSGKAVFADPANAHDLYLHSSHMPFVVSSVYRGRYGGLPFIATFHLHLADRGSNTLVSVMASNAEVLNGTKFGIGSCGPGQAWNCVKVQPTTVEEYSILRYLGRYLGVADMPAVILPAP